MSTTQTPQTNAANQVTVLAPCPFCGMRPNETTTHVFHPFGILNCPLDNTWHRLELWNRRVPGSGASALPASTDQAPQVTSFSESKSQQGETANAGNTDSET